MEDYDVTTLPDDYEPLVPKSTGGFRVFVVFCCVAILCLGGLGLYNYLSTGDVLYNVTTSEKEAVVEKYLEHDVKVQNTEEMGAMLKDGVLIWLTIEYLGHLSMDQKGTLQDLLSKVASTDREGVRATFRQWMELTAPDVLSVNVSTRYWY